jgi:uncharacterized 2Fe-2S/4Fe-4S cluster protein (DUF4445 family)
MPQEYRIRFLPIDRVYPAEKGENLLEIAMQAGVHINASCGGRGVCGKCRVLIAGGSVDSSTSPLLSEPDRAMGFRLACGSTITEDVVVEVPLESQIDRSILAPTAILRELDASADAALVNRFGREPLVARYYCDLPKPDINDNISDAARVARAISAKAVCDDVLVPPGVLRDLGSKLRDADWTVTVDVAWDACEILRVALGDRKDMHYAVAVDIGTTTISAELVDCRASSTGDVSLASATNYNRQISYGEDVISRIMHCRKRRGLAKLHDVVLTTINGLISDIILETKIDAADITHIVIAGNTTMMHLFYRVDPTYIMLAPYTPAATSFSPSDAQGLGFMPGLDARAYSIAGVSSYVGGDIVSGVALSGMTEKNGISLFMDIGTNGEIVLGNNEWLLCASCSAGPAFEGGGIEFGMRAAPGAIEKAHVNPATLEPMLLTIGHSPPLGICGSGLIDLVAELFMAGAIDRNGKFSAHKQGKRVREGRSGMEYVLCFASETGIERDIVLTEIDLDNILRTKAAVYAGCAVLLQNGGVRFADLESVIIAGGFGHSIDIEKAMIIGLLPELPVGRFRFMGNASLGGARMAALSRGFFAKTADIAHSMTNIELSGNTQFMHEFMAAMFLPHTDEKMFPEIMKMIGNRKSTKGDGRWAIG